jgi:nucleoside-triphosphatase THEP1
MTLNSQQQSAFDHIISMTVEGGNSKIRLSGEGGTGKTFVLTQAIEYITQELGGRVLVCAPTHMARQGLINKLSEETQRVTESKTIASLLGRYGFRTGEGDTAFAGGKIPVVDMFDLIVIDECSMLSQNDVNKIELINKPVVFTGDLKQLPVVKQKQANWDRFENIVLTEQVRQHGAILALAQKNREAIYIPTPEDMRPQDGLRMVKTDKDLVDQMLSDIKSGEREIYEHRYLTYTNEEVFAVNQLIHTTLFKELGSDPFIIGSYLILEQTCSAGYNSEIVRITNLVDTDNSNQYGVTTHTIEVEGQYSLKVVSPADRLKLNEEVKRIKELIKLARKTKNAEATRSLMRDLEFIEDNWVQVNYPYATTIHKSQGMTISMVYMNLDAINKASNKRALLYVGISRASDHLYLNEVQLSQDKIVRRVNKDYKDARSVYCELLGWEHWNYRVNNAVEYTDTKGKVKSRHLKCGNLDQKECITQGMLAECSIIRGSYKLAMMKCTDMIPQFVHTVCKDVSDELIC